MFLTEKAPVKIPMEYDGVIFCIDLAFDTVLTVLEIIETEELENYQKLHLILYEFTGKEFYPSEEYRAINQNCIVMSFEDMELFKNEIFEKYITEPKPKVYDVTGQEMPAPPDETKKVFDYKQDGKQIYASFIQAYGIDLIEQQGKLPWSKFKALMSGLPKDTAIAEIINIRQMDLPKKAKGNEKERERIRKLKRQYQLIDD